ncbi:sulfatase family protein [Kineococcus gypseus]|uniref:sulfatase family protein n=1 Tax=Kineococcus gypseus TaxID=1637102 RepID=UPI003D7D28E2
MSAPGDVPAREDAPREDVLLVHWHDLGRHLSCYGAGAPSPHLDALAAEGVLFTAAHATAPLCSPARGSLFTGRYPHSNGLVALAHHGFEYHDDVRTLPALLSAAGWRTALFGMQHETARPERLGFDEFDVTDSRCDWVVRRSEEWLEQLGPGPRAPFLLTAGFFETHRPYPPEDYPSADPGALRVPGYLHDDPSVREDLAAFHGSIAVADAAVGRLLAALERLGLDATTWVVFVTDHGEAFPGAKSTLYDAGTGIAVVVRPPRRRRVPPHVHDGLFSGVDLVPTLLDVLGVQVPEEVEGLSHAPALLAAGADVPPVRTEVFTQKTFHDSYDPVRAVRTATHSYIESYAPRPRLDLPLDIAGSPSGASLGPEHRRPRPERELYDLRSDPHERSNLADRPEVADLQRDLAQRLHRWRESTGDVLPSLEEGEAVAARFMAAHLARLGAPPREPRSSGRGIVGPLRSPASAAPDTGGAGGRA